MIATPATPTNASAIGQRAPRPRRRAPAVLSALSPAMSDCERLVASATPDAATVLVAAKAPGPMVRCEAGPIRAWAAGASDAVESAGGPPAPGPGAADRRPGVSGAAGAPAGRSARGRARGIARRSASLVLVVGRAANPAAGVWK